MTELTSKEEQKIKELAVDYFEGNPLGLPPTPSSADVIEGTREALRAAVDLLVKIEGVTDLQLPYKSSIWETVRLGRAAVVRFDAVRLNHDSQANKIRALEHALQAADEAINPSDRSGISLNKWNQRLRAATATIRDALTLPDSKPDNQRD